MLQIKHLPPELHEALRARAERSGTTMSALAVQILGRELSRPSTDEWLRRIRSRPPLAADADPAEALDAARAELDR